MYVQIPLPQRRLDLQVSALVEPEDRLLSVTNSFVLGAVGGGAGADYLSGELPARYQGQQHFLDVTQPDRVLY